ncbi:MotE family protein [Alkalihalophilus pseudofirmus]|uniref:MotE family protein n=1 Tax=Alkalihalophilus pseudofirmus TaxID=79885 RepID=A0AAJ2U263_ALKPS|nr:MotE family protein [Alkalihalophilus pseudofirmus]MDV2885272.1 MotE family protein [Alkalihalophilus pseudofirmus]
MSKKEKTHSKLQMFVLVILIPVIFGVIFFSVILNMIGFDVLGTAKQAASSIPYVSSLMEDDEEDIIESETEEQDIDTTADQNEIALLQQQIAERDSKITELENEVIEMEQRLLVEQELNNNATQELSEIAKTYEAMSAKNAAAIISELQTEEALLHLSQLKTDSRAAILSKMDSAVAADLMSRLTSQ